MKFIRIAAAFDYTIVATSNFQSSELVIFTSSTVFTYLQSSVLKTNYRLAAPALKAKSLW